MCDDNALLYTQEMIRNRQAIHLPTPGIIPRRDETVGSCAKGCCQLTIDFCRVFYNRFYFCLGNAGDQLQLVH